MEHDCTLITWKNEKDNWLDIFKVLCNYVCWWGYQSWCFNWSVSWNLESLVDGKNSWSWFILTRPSIGSSYMDSQGCPGFLPFSNLFGISMHFFSFETCHPLFHYILFLTGGGKNASIAWRQRTLTQLIDVLLFYQTIVFPHWTFWVPRFSSNKYFLYLQLNGKFNNPWTLSQTPGWTTLPLEVANNKSLQINIWIRLEKNSTRWKRWIPILKLTGKLLTLSGYNYFPFLWYGLHRVDKKKWLRPLMWGVTCLLTHHGTSVHIFLLECMCQTLVLGGMRLVISVANPDLGTS